MLIFNELFRTVYSDLIIWTRKWRYDDTETSVDFIFDFYTAITLTIQQFPRETMSSEMQVSDLDFRSFSYEEELQRAKWFKEDLEKGKWKLLAWVSIYRVGFKQTVQKWYFGIRLQIF